jgi:hypothetical protein
MPAHQGFKSRFFAVVQEALQQFPIGSVSTIREQREALQFLAEIIHALGCLRPLRGRWFVSRPHDYIVLERSRFIQHSFA